VVEKVKFPEINTYAVVIESNESESILTSTAKLQEKRLHTFDYDLERLKRKQIRILKGRYASENRIDYESMRLAAFSGSRGQNLLCQVVQEDQSWNVNYEWDKLGRTFFRSVDSAFSTELRAASRNSFMGTRRPHVHVVLQTRRRPLTKRQKMVVATVR